MMMKSTHETALSFRDQMAKTAKAVRASRPLRVLAKRKVTLMRQAQHLGHLELLLRLSFKGEGQGTGVLVFEWPSSAEGHSVIRVLKNWSDRCGEAGTCQHGVIELECRPTPLPGVHLKVGFPVAEAPEELLELAARTGLLDRARAEIERSPELTVEEPAKEPAEEPLPRVESMAGTNGQDQSKIDAITHNALFDPKVHPHVNPNEEVCSSSGVMFRPVMKRMGGMRRRVWLHVSNGTKAAAPKPHAKRHTTP
jgi:hypothetical protein